ncbi:MAG TPA: hypothetical protein VHW47_07510, partial [Acidimicrobiales bacterium]|nr:hypothetical protein [Acidimicrobiales bacterium]
GLDAGWQRAWYRADVATAGSPSRTARLVTREPVVVDALTTPNPGTLSIYPAAVCYRLAAPYLQATETVSLGHGIRATVDFANPFAAVSPTDAQWVLLTWTWRIPQTTYGDVQRITVLTLDGTPNAKGVPVPAPPGANDGVRSTFTDILRGASTEGSPTPSSSAMGRLTAFARAIVAHQVHTAQVGNR